MVIYANITPYKGVIVRTPQKGIEGRDKYSEANSWSPFKAPYQCHLLYGYSPNSLQEISPTFLWTPIAIASEFSRVVIQWARFHIYFQIQLMSFPKPDTMCPFYLCVFSGWHRAWSMTALRRLTNERELSLRGSVLWS